MSIYNELDKVVELICDSFENDPHNWIFETYTCNHKHGKFLGGKELWTSEMRFDMWDGRTRHRVFTDDQINLLRKYYIIARRKAGSELQKEIVKASFQEDSNKMDTSDNDIGFKDELKQLLMKHNVKKISYESSFWSGDALRFSFDSAGNSPIEIKMCELP